MRIAIVYIFPQVGVDKYTPFARRFVDSYLENPPGVADHQVHVFVNGGVPGPLHTRLFNPLTCVFHPSNNFGKDIGAFQVAAHTIPCDLLVCFGAHIYFPRAGWLDYMVRAYQDNGPALYGNYCFHQPTPHVRTTNFWLPPQLLASYPHQVSDGNRYEFEHGITGSIVRHVLGLGYPALQLTWTGVYAMTDWHHITNEEMVVRDQHTG